MVFAYKISVRLSRNRTSVAPVTLRKTFSKSASGVPAVSMRRQRSIGDLIGPGKDMYGLATAAALFGDFFRARPRVIQI